MKHLFKIISPNGVTHHIMGTIHLKDPRIALDYGRLEGLVRESELVVTEYDLSSAPMVSQESLLLPEGQTNSALLGEKWGKRLGDYLSKNGLPLEALDKLAPFWLLQTLTGRLISEEGDLSPDEWLSRTALANGIPTGGLETFEAQLALSLSLDQKTSLKGIKKLLKDELKVVKGIDSLIENYMSNSPKKLLGKAKKQLGKWRKPMLYDRNRIMADSIGNLCDQKLMVGIGAAHLYGKKGVLALLRKNDWLVLKK